MSQDYLEIRGARVHSLKNIDLRLPHNKLIVVTGVSGSGKSSLVFDTIYAEGQRRYVESLSSYARQFLERIEKPDVDEIHGIAPAIAIRQKNSSRNPRSTVATATEIYDFLRLLFARAGRTFCSKCGEQVRKDTADEVATRILELPEASRWYVLFPVHGWVKDDTDALKERLADLRGKGFNRLYQDGRLSEFSSPESLLDLDFSKPFYALVDRLSIRKDLRERVADAVETCYRESHEVLFENATESAQRLWFSERFDCRQCGIEYLEPEPRLFSFNSPYGACPRCQGFGNTIDIDLDRVIPDRFKSLEEGAIDPWTKPRYVKWHAAMLDAAWGAGVRTTVPYHELTAKERDFVAHGAGKGFKGLEGFWAYLETKKYKMHVRIFMSRYRGYALCPDCEGGRLRAEALNVRVGEKNIREVTHLTLDRAKQFFETLQLEGQLAHIAVELVRDIVRRLTFLNDVGLEYLSLDRLSSTLSGGEAQRIQLATSLGSRLVGACYVLDEPSIGLHGRDTARLIRILENLRDIGNTIIVVEHDADVMRSADYIVDLGPGAGEHGGEVVFSGTASELVAKKSPSLTGRYLRGETAIPVPKKRRKVSPRKQIKFQGAYVHNLKNIEVSIPRDLLTVVTGVSGSGKSTLVRNIVFDGLQALRKGAGGSSDSEDFPRLPCRKITGHTQISDIVFVDQSPIGRTPRSNPVTYVKAFDVIRELFAFTMEAKRKRMAPGHFSFNIPGGRCETCQGDGTVTVEMQFLADVALLCEDCDGKRYKQEVLDVRYQGKNIHDVLRLTIDEALSFFVRTPKITHKLAQLSDVGLGYLRLGQSATTLSGGEAQRVKLASHVAQSKSDTTLYLFDEPTTGLHFDDIKKLLAAFDRLLDHGATLLVIEHNLDIIKCADWVIDLGPEGGDRGGEIVVQGTPEKVAKSKKSYTGRQLAGVLDTA
ncbi:MAG: excinuclease ABC subunit UvrA [Acidobacteria bacterium]|nr:excinuclease ABC subunit UvrA [Acidobacteriota bacterium]